MRGPDVENGLVAMSSLFEAQNTLCSRHYPSTAFFTLKWWRML